MVFIRMRHCAHLRHFTPHSCMLSQVEAVWERLEQMAGSMPTGGLLAPVTFVKIKGETWAPPSFAVPDRFGKPAVCVLRR